MTCAPRRGSAGARRRVAPVPALALVVLLSGCSINKLALRKVSSLLTSTSSSNVFSSDNDPEFVAQALPFAVKLYESLLGSLPDNTALRVRTGSLYIMYANAFIETPAEMRPREDMEKRDAELDR